LNVVGEKEAIGAAPFPASATVCAIPLALEAIVSVPGAGPYPIGEKETLIVQLAPVANDAGQLFVCEYGTPGTLILFMPRAAVPELVSVTGNGALVVPIN